MTAPTYTKGENPVEFLRTFNTWRRGYDGDMPDPQDIGLAIDEACARIEALEDRLHHSKLPSAHPLRAIYGAAIDQLTHGKGERHGGDATPFLQQPWIDLADTYGVGFLYGQSAKKAREAMGKEGEARERELLGALNYLAMGILYEQIRK